MSGLALIINDVIRTSNVLREDGVSLTWLLGGSRNTAKFTIYSADGSYIPECGHDVQWFDSTGQKIWCGVIYAIQPRAIYAKSAAGVPVVTVCNCVGYEASLDKRMVAIAVYDSKTCREIIEDIFTVRLPEGGHEDINYALSTVNDGATLDRYVIDHQRVNDILDDLATRSNCIWWVGRDKELYFVPRTTSPASYRAPFTITDAAPNARELSVSRSRDGYRNRQHIRISYNAFAASTQTIIGDGATTSWTLYSNSSPTDPSLVNYIESIKVISPATEEEKTFGLLGVDTDKDFYYEQGDSTLTQGGTSPITPYTSDQQIVVTWRHLGGDVITVENGGEIATRAAIESGTWGDSTGIYEHMIDASSEIDAVAHLAYAQEVLNSRDQIGTEVNGVTDRGGLLPGQVLDINVTTPPFSGSILIDQVDAELAADGTISYSFHGSTTAYDDWVKQWNSVLSQSGSSSLMIGGGVSGGTGAPLPDASNLAATYDIAPEGHESEVHINLTGTAPTYNALSGLGIYVEVPAEEDAAPSNPTLPGVVFFNGEQYVESGAEFSLDLYLPIPPKAYLASLPDTAKSLKWIVYAATRSVSVAPPLVRLQTLDPPTPEGYTPFATVTMSFQAYLDDLEGSALVDPSIVSTSASLTNDGVQIAISYLPPHTGLNGLSIGTFTGVAVYSSTPDESGNKPCGEWPYEGIFGAGDTTEYGTAYATVPRPSSFPAKAVVQIPGVSATEKHSPNKITWTEGEPSNVPGFGIAVEITDSVLTMQAATISSVQIETREVDGNWQWRIATTLSGAALLHPQYRETKVYCRFSTEAVPSTDEGWATLRIVGDHVTGAAPTVYSDWWVIRPGVSEQIYLRAVSISDDGEQRRWSSAYGPVSVTLSLGGVIPGLDHTWNFAATFVGYTSDGNGVRWGRVDLSWTPLSQAGILYGFYQYRGPSQPPASAYTPTDCNSVESSVTMWVPPPASGSETLWLALIPNDTAQGIWPKPTDFATGKLQTASVVLPQPGSSDQVTDFSVTVEDVAGQDVPSARFVFSFTKPADPDYAAVHIYRRPCSSDWTPIRDYYSDPVAGMITPSPQQGSWPKPTTPEYWEFKCQAFNSLGQENTVNPPTCRVTVEASTGVTAAAVKPSAVASSGPLTVSNGQIMIPVSGISSNYIENLAVEKLNGQISASQIATVNAGSIQGSISASQIGAVNATSVQGTLSASQIGAVNASSITGVIVTEQLADQILDTARLLSSSMAIPVKVASLPTLPDANYPVGSLVLLTTTKVLYQNVSNAWQQTTASAALSGKIGDGDITGLSASKLSGQISASQIASINSTQIVGLITAGQIESVNADCITGSLSSSVVGNININNLSGTLSADRVDGVITTGNIGTVNINTLAGTLSASKIGTINATSVYIDQNCAFGVLYVSGNAYVAQNFWAANIFLNGQAGGEISGGTAVFNYGNFGNVSVGTGISGNTGATCVFPTGLFTLLKANDAEVYGTFTVGGNALKSAAYKAVGTGSSDVAAGNHSHTVTVNLNVSKTNIAVWDPDAQSTNYYDVVTDVTVASVSVT